MLLVARHFREERAEVFVDEAAALAAAEARARAAAEAQALEAGAASPEVEVTRNEKRAAIDGRERLIEARVVAVARGRPGF